MRKPPSRKETRSFEEILEEGLGYAFLHSDKILHGESRTRKERQRMLREYAEIVDLPGAQTSEGDFERSNRWYSRHRFPGFLGKDSSRGDLTKPIEVCYPILMSAKSLKALLYLYEKWKSEDTPVLSQLLIRVNTADPVSPRIDGACDAFEQQIELNRQKQKQQIALILEKRRAQKYRRHIDLARVANWPSVFKVPPDARTAVQFRGVERAWYADYVAFASCEIKPFMAHNAELDASTLLAAAEDQLTKAVNIMLRGIQQVVARSSVTGEIQFQYNPECDWHLIATAFAEMIVNKELAPRFCSACGVDIGSMKKGALRCVPCARSKRR